METFRLLCHPECPANNVRGITVEVIRNGNALTLTYRVDCAADLLALPLAVAPERTDGLWQHTCFEAFISNGEGGYAEFNFSPSGQWAAYDFDGYRSGMCNRGTPAPLIDFQADQAGVRLNAKIDLSGLSGALSLTAVIEEADGTKSYWALNHAEGKPDFHHPACFAAKLPAPGEA